MTNTHSFAENIKMVLSTFEVSFFGEKGIKQIKPCLNTNLGSLFNKIKEGAYDYEIQRYRGSKAKELKNRLPYFTPSGTFTSRSNNNLVKHSGIICIDFDSLQDDLETAQSELYADPFTFAGFVSPSGNGIKLLVKIPICKDDKEHKESFYALERYYLHNYNYAVDKACKDVARACFVSSDPNLFLSEYSPIFKEKDEEPTKKKPLNNASKAITAPNDNFDYDNAFYCAKELQSRNIDITPTYNDWISVGFSLATLGEQGRELFQLASSCYAKYEYSETDKKFSELLKNKKGSHTLATFFEYCQMAGIQFKERFAKQSTANTPKNATAYSPSTTEQATISPQPQVKEQGKANNISFSDFAEMEKMLTEQASKDVIFASPIITRDDIPIIRQGTINVIQGKQGSHKSRLAGLFVSLLLAKSNPNVNNYDFLGFKKNLDCNYTIAYIDTERNVKEEFPYAIQNMRELAGLPRTEPQNNFRYFSLKKIPREQRLDVMKGFIEYVRTSTNNHLVVFLDVITDCVRSFNDDKDALALWDYIGNLCDDHNATFFTIIHENFGTEKARGHVGTEASNKASTVFQIGYDKDKQGNDLELVKIKYMKCRTAKKPLPFYAEYSEFDKGLVLADFEAVKELQRTQLNPQTQVIDMLESMFDNKTVLEQKEIISHGSQNLEMSRNTIIAYLDKIQKEGNPILDKEGNECTLKILKQRGKTTTYELCKN